MMYDYGYGPGYGFDAFGFIWHILAFAIVVCAIIWLVRMCVGGRHGRWRGRRPWWDNAGSGIEILNERFAKGEIDKAEYEERKKTLLG